jgi:hypothetical protein
MFLGISRGSAISLLNPLSFIKLWAHESLRVFSDRMINNEDQRYFEKLMAQIVQSEWGRDWQTISGGNTESMIWVRLLLLTRPPSSQARILKLASYNTTSTTK